MSDERTGPRRKDDVDPAAFYQEFRDFVKQSDRDRDDTMAWRLSYDKKINDLQKAVDPLLQAHNVGFWVFITLFGAFLIAAGTFVFNWFQKHFN